MSWEAYHLALQFGNQTIAAWQLSLFGYLMFIQGQNDEAFRYYQQSLAMLQRIHHRQDPAVIRGQISELLTAKGRPDEAIPVLQGS